MPRFISMKNFASKKAQALCITSGQEVPLARVLGVVYEVETKVSKLPDGTTRDSVIAHGEFEGVNLETGEVTSAMSIYLPKYFAEAIARGLKSVKSLTFAVEISVRPTGASIPFAYEVKNLIARDTAHPMEALKRAMLAQKVDLKGIPGPVDAPALIPAAIADAGASVADDSDPGDETAPVEGDEGAVAAPAGKGRGRKAS